MQTILMARRSHICLWPFGVAIYWPNSCASLCCYSSNPELMLLSSWATCFAFAWHWEAEQFDRTKDCSHGFRRIPRQHTQDMQALYCTAPCSYLAVWIVHRVEWRCVHWHRNIYMNDSVALLLKRISIWRRQLVSPLDLLLSICCFT